MRNWNTPFSSTLSFPLELPDYLWGIETGITLWVSYLLFKASRLPMRNWNRIRRERPNEWKKASRLPMRNWNKDVIEITNPMEAASRLPMRNWNSASLTLSLFTTRGFQTTYEELKQGCLFQGSHRSPCFQTTYEELKPSHSITPFFLESCASRLPMRNWNMGESRLQRWPPLASRLPMRNWNLRFLSFFIPPFGFQTTYEELKQVHQAVIAVNYSCFQTTYEELKLNRSGLSFALYIASRLPMRNWNMI